MTSARRALFATATLTCLVFGSLQQPAFAQSAAVIQACADAAGTLRLLAVGSSRACRSNETPISWNVQGPRGLQGAPGVAGLPGAPGPQGPAGPQTVLNAAVLSNGTIQVSSLPAGATLAVTRVQPGQYNVAITGLGNGCPLLSATALETATFMWVGGGNCGFGTLNIPVFSGNNLDVNFLLTVVGLGPATAAASTAAPRSSAVTILGDR